MGDLSLLTIIPFVLTSSSQRGFPPIAPFAPSHSPLEKGGAGLDLLASGRFGRSGTLLGPTNRHGGVGVGGLGGLGGLGAAGN